MRIKYRTTTRTGADADADADADVDVAALRNDPAPTTPPLLPPAPTARSATAFPAVSGAAPLAVSGAAPPGAVKRRRWVGLAAAVVAFGLIGGSLFRTREPLVGLAIVFVLVVPLEKLFPRHRQPIRRPQLFTDLAFALSGPILNAVGLAAAVVVGVVSLAWLPGLLVRPLVSLLPGPLLPIVGILLFDLAIYWTHRWYHEVPLLWRFHAVHHSTEHLDWVSGFRAHPLDGTLLAPAFIFLIAAGFSPEFTGVLAAVQIVTGLFLHANVRWRLRWLHRIIITPEFHHWHHANEPGAINTNYAVFLPIWDQAFGTYFMPAHRRPQRYGVSEYLPEGMVAQLWHPLRGLPHPWRVVTRPKRSTSALFSGVRQLLRDMARSATRPRLG